MTDSLLPCPFCGGSAYIDGSERDGFYASCSDCYCCVGEAYDRHAMPEHMFRTQEDAAKQWNVRVTPAPQDLKRGDI